MLDGYFLCSRFRININIRLCRLGLPDSKCYLINTLRPLGLKMFLSTIKTEKKLERRLSSLQHLLLMQRIWVPFPAPS